MQHAGILSDLSLFAVSFSICCAILVAWIIYESVFSPLAQFGGPPLASISTTWRQWHIWKGTLSAELNKWHCLHGKFVRIGPNELYAFSELPAMSTLINLRSISNPDMVQTMLALPVDQSSKIHFGEDWAQAIVGSEVYGPVAMKTYQLHIDTAILRFMPRLEMSLDKVVDLSEELLEFCSEVLSETLLSRNTLSFRNISKMEVTEASWLRRLKSILCTFRDQNQEIGFKSTILQEIRKRKVNEYEKRDILGGYIAVQQTLDLDVSDASLARIAASCLSHGIAPLAACLCKVLVLLYANRTVLSELRTEVDNKWKEGMLSDPVRLEEAARMPYLNAVVNEAMASPPEQYRQLQPRVVSGKGMTVDGVKVPRGTKLRLRSKTKEVETFNPEMSNSSSSPSQTGVFGGGSGACRGQRMFCHV
jgi:hypothetical protein